MGRGDLTVHGFRTTFRDWAGEVTAHPREVVEHALAHQLKDRAEAAYARGDLFMKRSRLMEDWARSWRECRARWSLCPSNRWERPHESQPPGAHRRGRESRFRVTTDHTPDDIRTLAARFCIEDAAALWDAWLGAVDAAVDAHVEQVNPAYQSDVEVAQHARLTKLLAALQAELTAFENSSALTRGAEAELFRRELQLYAEWLANMPANPQPERRGNPGDGTSRAFVAELARQWPCLPARRHRHGGITSPVRLAAGSMSSRALWPDRWPDSMLPWVDFPSVSTVRRWLADVS